MSQQEVLELLKEKGELTAQEIADILQLQKRSIRNCLTKLLRHSEVERIRLTKVQVEAKGVKYSGRHYKWTIRKENGKKI